MCIFRWDPCNLIVIRTLVHERPKSKLPNSQGYIQSSSTQISCCCCCCCWCLATGWRSAGIERGDNLFVGLWPFSDLVTSEEILQKASLLRKLDLLEDRPNILSWRPENLSPDWWWAVNTFQVVRHLKVRWNKFIQCPPVWFHIVELTVNTTVRSQKKLKVQKSRLVQSRYNVSESHQVRKTTS